jgi:RNA:NAD 2'-phosphotransferase (TPT1/KptA family)
VVVDYGAVESHGDLQMFNMGRSVEELPVLVRFNLVIPANTGSLPDAYLFHGTAASNLDFIDCFGLQPNGRRYVQLTSDFEYAMEIASRNAGEAVVLQIRTAAALESGVHFFATRTHVWLATAIPSDCLQTWITQAPFFDELAF